MFNLIAEMLSYDFILRAFIVGVLVALCAALLGVSLVLKRYSMIGDGLSHVGFGTLSIAVALGLAPLWVSAPLTLLAAFLLLRISENSRIKGDAAIAIISGSSLAIGVVVLALTTGLNTDVCNYLFGTILAMKKSDVYLSICLAAVVLALFILFYNKIFAVTFDEAFAKATGTRTGLYNALIAALTGLIIVVGMRIMGAMLISSLIIFPALSAMRVFRSFKKVAICAAILSTICFLFGLLVSYTFDTPAGASVVLVNLAAFLLFALFGQMRRRIALFAPMLLAILLVLPACSSKDETTDAPTNSIGTASVDVGDESSATDDGTQTDTETNANSADTDIIDIGEKMFVGQMNDIYANTDDYIGKTIRYEGFYVCYEDESTGASYPCIIRNGPGCCGYDSQVGFEFSWDGELPQDDDWCRLTGVVAIYQEDGFDYIKIDATNLEILPVRGNDTVTQ